MTDLIIIKRDGKKEIFDLDKVVNAIKKSGEDTGEFGIDEATFMAEKVLLNVATIDDGMTVECVQDEVERELMSSGYLDTAKAYILYRERKSQERMPDVFKKRVNLKPYEYPIMEQFKDAIRQSYWVHTEFNYTADIQDYLVNVSETERNAIKNAMLAISQVEVAVKAFWGDLGDRMPKPEIAAVGDTFAESEVRHHDAYSHFLEIMGLNEEFEKIGDIPALNKRVKYLSDAVSLAKSESNRDFTKTLLLFSLFTEHVSLFSQFLIIMSFNKHRNLFKGMSNVIEATSKEEQLHGLFGIELIKIIREEHPEWFDEDMEKEVYEACKLAYESEVEVIEWIFEKGELDFLSIEVVKEFVKQRLNNSLVSTGYTPIFDTNEELLEESDWFDDEILSTKDVDFFVKRSINYTKRSRSITGDDLF